MKMTRGTALATFVRKCHEIAPAVLRETEELTVHEVAKHFGASDSVVYYWIEHRLILA